MTKAPRPFDPRPLMERAVEVMRASIPERRGDGKSIPYVGAVLLKVDGTIETASRGELRDGDHAEYTLLERKNRSNALDGAILFATLEPCAPGSRSTHKLPCAERIVLARIRQVWVGIADPDPTVNRKGIKYLQDNGVDVQMFERDLQEIIENENREFLAQALERARQSEDLRAKPVTLHEFENPAALTVLRDLSTPALEAYRSRARIEEAVGSTEFNRLLLRQGFLSETGNGLVPTGFGALLFGKKPRRVMHQAGLLALIRYADGDDERREFDEPLVLIPDLLESWLRDKLPNISDRNTSRRKELPAVPYELVREGVVNALVHRDYDIVGAKCQLTVTDQTVEIRSPGRPPAPVTLEQLQSFTAPMLSRNPALHYVFAQMELAEEQGMGIRAMRTRARELGLATPRYGFDDPYVVLTLYRNPASAAIELRRSLTAKLSDDEVAVWQVAADASSITSRGLQEHLHFDERKVQRLLRKLIELNLIRKLGEGRATRYELVR